MTKMQREDITKCWCGCGTAAPHLLLGGMEIGTTTSKNKPNGHISEPSISNPRCMPQKHVYQKTYKTVHSSVIHSFQKLEITQMPIYS